MLFLDTSFLIADSRKADAHYPRACELRAGFRESTAITDQVFSEFITYISKKDGPERAYALGRIILESDVNIVHLASDDLPAALELVRKYGHLSFFDASTIVIAQKMGTVRIVSFDSDFDRVPGIKRLS